MNHRGALRLGQDLVVQEVTCSLEILTAYQFGLRSDHVLAFHPTCDCHGGTVIRLTMEFRLT